MLPAALCDLQLTRISTSGSFAALLFVLITAIGPFSQQIISVQTAMQDSYPLRNSQSPYMATVPILEVDSVNNAIQSTVYTGLFSRLDTNFTVTPDNCRGVNCSWPIYASLFVRHQCHDITAFLNTSLLSDGLPNGTSWVKLTLPNAHSLNLTVPAPPFHQPFFPGATNISSGFRPLTFLGQGNVLLYTSILHLPRIDWGFNRTQTVSEAIRQATAVECMLQTVARPFTATSVDGVFNEYPAGPDITNNSDYAIWTSPWQVWYNESSLAGPEILAAADAVANLPREDITYDVPQQYLQGGYDIEGQQAVEYHFSSNPKGMAVMSLFLTNVFQGSTDSANFARCEPGQMNLKGITNFAWGCGIQPTAFSTIATLLSNLATWPYGAHTDSENPALPIIEAVFENVATSLSTAMRQSGVNTTIALGTRQVSTITYAVEWRWMCVPTALCALVLILSLLVIKNTKRRGIKVWKGNPVATSVHGINSRAKFDLMDWDLRMLRKAADSRYGRLDRYCDEIVVEPADDMENSDLESMNLVVDSGRSFSARC